ncbi:MAG: endolytic transglycosylase MltG [Cryomorphaceae bacterium]|nr:endolytic transglycosylase MltG [Cryomorphaceae bacterium]
MKRVVWAVVILAVIGIAGYVVYGRLNSPVTSFTTAHKDIFIATGSELDDVVDILVRDSIIVDEDAFRWMAESKKYTANVKPGKYRIPRGINLNKLINKLRSGDQLPVRVVFNAMRTPEMLAGKIASQLEVDSVTMLDELKNSHLADSLGFSKEGFRTMFIPNTYEFWWNTDARGFINRMANEYRLFWTEDRKAKAAERGLSQTEVVVLASIVQAETAKRDEAPKIAGLYLNRLRIGMPLQADPTLIYAAQDFSIRRVLDIHKNIDSPYNTYRNVGLPPGPINYPDFNYIDAVLNPDQNKYLYMCAKPDFSGYHNFATNYDQHLVYARQYQRALSNQ